MRNQEIRKGQHNSFFLSVARASLLRSRNCYVPRNQRPPFLRFHTPLQLFPDPRVLLLQHPFRRVFSRPLHGFTFHSSSSRRSLVNKNKLFLFRHSVATRPRIASLRSALHGLALARSFVQEIIFLCIGKHARIVFPFPVNPATRPAGYFTLHRFAVFFFVGVSLAKISSSGARPCAPSLQSNPTRYGPPALALPGPPSRCARLYFCRKQSGTTGVPDTFRPPPAPLSPNPSPPAPPTKGNGLRKIWGEGGLYRPEGLGGSSSFHSSGTPVVHLVQSEMLPPNRRAPGNTS